MSFGGANNGGVIMVITPEVITTVIFLMKMFGAIIVSLLSVICVLGGVIWKDLRAEIKIIKNEVQDSVKGLKEDEKDKCSFCSMKNKEEHDALTKECEELWEAVEVCCPRGK